MHDMSKAAWLLGSNPAQGMDVCLLCLYAVLSCEGLCNELITHPEESYLASNCVIKKPQYRGGQSSDMGCSVIAEK
jgi:hypothetical protein